MSKKRDISTAGHDTPRQKKYHRRAVWACDECRLRKIKCDGDEPCGHCNTIDHHCSYEGRSRPPLAPTKRIRVLEETLRNVRDALRNFRPGLADTVTADRIDSILRILEPASIGEFDHSPPATRESVAVPSPVSYGSPTKGPAAAAPITTRAPRRKFNSGKRSGQSLICQMSEMFQGGKPISSQASAVQEAAMELFARDEICNRSTLPSETTPAPSLPSRADFSELYSASSGTTSLLCQVVNDKELEDLLEDLASDHPPSVTLSLLHSIAAMGYGTEGLLHRRKTCQVTIQRASDHFVAARRYLDWSHNSGQRSLQALLCLTQYLLSRSDVITAHTYISIACSWIIQDSSSRSTALRTRRDGEIVLLTLQLSSQICTILDLPMAIHRNQIGDFDSMLLSGQSAKISIDQRSGDNSMLSASYWHFQLLEITHEGLELIYDRKSPPIPFSGYEDDDHIDGSRLGSVEGRIQELIELASSNSRRLGDAVAKDSAIFELEMTTYFCQLALYMPFLHHTVSMANGVSVSRTRSQRVLACIKIASKTISLLDSPLKYPRSRSISWIQTYTLFLAVVTLMVLIAAHHGTTHPSEAWKKAELGIRLLAALRCYNNGASRCLRVVRALIDQLRHTVEFDVDDIERTTIPLCQSEHVHGHNKLSESSHRTEPGTEKAKTARSSVPLSVDRMFAKANDSVLFGDSETFGRV